MNELSFKRALTVSGLLHVGIAFLLMYEFHNARPTLVADTVNEPGVQQVAKVEPIRAVSVDSQEVMHAVEQLKQSQQAKVRAEQQHQQQLVQAAKAAQVAREREQAKLAQLKLEALKVAKDQKKKLEEEKKHLAELKQKQIELKKQQAEQAREVEKAKKLAEAMAAKQKAELARKEQAMKAQQDAKLAAESALRSARMAGEVDKYKALIIGAIGRQWILPDNVDPHLSSQFRIHLAPNGVVLDVSLSKSSGDPILDRSAQAAIYKASPLPVPSDPGTFNLFREISLTVKPENVRG